MKILATTDFSTRADHALERAALLGRLFSAELQLLHVVDDDQPMDWVHNEIRQARQMLQVKAKELRASSGADPQIAVATGDPFQEIVQASVESGADLIVMGPHRRRILRDVFIGTTIERVMRTGHRPVLMVNQAPGGPYRSVIVATDISEASGNALLTAKSLGLFHDARVSLLHVFEPLAKSMMIYASIERERIEDQVAVEAAETKRALMAFIDDLGLGEHAFDVRLVEGPTFHGIRTVVENEQPDLLVIGTRGISGPRRILLGSVADAVLRGIECDILAVPLKGP